MARQFERNQVMDAGRPFWRVAATAQSMMTSLLQKLLLVDGCLADKFIVLVSAQGCSNKTPLGAPGLTTSNKKLLVPKIG